MIVKRNLRELLLARQIKLHRARQYLTPEYLLNFIQKNYMNVLKLYQLQLQIYQHFSY